MTTRLIPHDFRLREEIPVVSSGANLGRERKRVRFAPERDLLRTYTINYEAREEGSAVSGFGNVLGVSSEKNSEQRATRELTVLSSAHGRARREQREISKFDLQSAIKYGVKKRGRSCPKTKAPRWMYVYGNCVYITDEASTREVTSYKEAVRIQPAEITPTMMARHEQDIQSLNGDPQLCASHSIIVIDQSASMKVSDVVGFRNRSQAAYGVLALEYIAEQLHGRPEDNGTLDVVSIIEMNDTGSAIFEREPLDWIFFNKVLDRQRKAAPKSHGNYNEALKSVKQLIDREPNSGMDADDMACVAVTFVSDGKPSDKRADDSILRMDILQGIVAAVTSNISVHAIGIGAYGTNFAALVKMASVVSELGADGTFTFSELSFAKMSAAFSSASSKMTNTRTEKLSVNRDAKQREQKVVTMRRKSVPNSERNFTQHFFGVSRWWYFPVKKSYPWKEVEFKNRGACGFDIEKDPFGVGAERLAYMFHEVDQRGRRVGKSMVAKESKYLDGEERKIRFHEAFCRTQKRASEFADQFNHVVLKTPGLWPSDRDMKTPAVYFLECSVYEYWATNGQRCGLLVEDLLQGKFTKFNSNNGFYHNAEGGRKICLQVGEVYPTDFVQAFSHWVYYSTDQRLLLCDLQGVLNEEGRYLKFELTDPCICSKPEHGSERYGRSDMRMVGFRTFRKSHKCNRVCVGLGLPSFGSRTTGP